MKVNRLLITIFEESAIIGPFFYNLNPKYTEEEIEVQSVSECKKIHEQLDLQQEYYSRLCRGNSNGYFVLPVKTLLNIYLLFFVQS